MGAIDAENRGKSRVRVGCNVAMCATMELLIRCDRLRLACELEPCVALFAPPQLLRVHVDGEQT
jgi:hypothetical protein